ncbi:MAG: hypothetical protein U0556_19565 [Dehalococcoidia bacterium]
MNDRGISRRSLLVAVAGGLALGAAWRQAAAAEAGPLISFIINVHDWRNPDESADTLLRLVELFSRHGVRGDFYLTPTMADLYAARRPEVVAALGTMTISHHVRPPHPLNSGFGAPLAGLSGPALEAALRDYQTYRLDLATGGLDRSAPGGFTFMTDLFGRPPTVVGSPSDNPTIRPVAKRLYREFGGRAIVRYHEEGTAIDRPFEYDAGLLVRPSDFSVTRWSNARVKEQFWWNMLTGLHAADFVPLAYLQRRLAGWNASRPPIITALIHENNLVRQGPESFTLCYFADRDKNVPLSPPFDLNAPDLSRRRSAGEQAAIWAAYEEMVAWSAANLTVVTSEDLVAMAVGERVWQFSPIG